MTSPQVLIAGAGPTGLALALWLARLGISIRIIDKTAEAAPFSRAIGVHARTLELYRQWDNISPLNLANEMVEDGVEATGVNLWLLGRKAARVPFRRAGEGLSPFPFVLMFPQDAHERLLLERLATLGLAVERQTELLRFDQTRDGVQAVLKRPDGSEEICEAAWLAGCDGAHSAVRHNLMAGFPGGIYSRLFFVADVDAKSSAVNGEINAELEETDLLVIFPLKGSNRVRLVGTVGEESLPRDRELTFDDVRGRAMQRLGLNVSRVNWFSTYQVHHRVAHHFRDRRAFLLGDAAHIHSPVGAQGMNTGIGDAVNLSWKLAAVLKGEAREDILDTYESERRAFARRLVATTDRMFTIATASGAFARRIRTMVIPVLAPLVFKLRPVPPLVFRTVSQIGLHYRASALSSGRAGKIRGGDRLPWLRLTADQDNFAPLSSLSWQAHVYGEPRSGVPQVCAELRIPLHRFVWKPEMKKAGFLRQAVYMIRPDGYVALADASGDANRLREWFANVTPAAARSARVSAMTPE